MSDTFAAFQDITACIHLEESAEMLTNRGVVHQFMNDRVNAMKDYQRAIKLDSTYSLAYFNAANVYFHTRHFKQVCVCVLLYPLSPLFKIGKKEQGMQMAGKM